MLTIALGGDTMLGRGVAAALDEVAPDELFAEEVAAAARAADLTLVNLECCISDRGERWPDPRKPFHFRAPPAAVGTLGHLGVDVVTLANNHALDFGEDALLDTLGHLHDAGIAVVGAGRDVTEARRPAILDVGGVEVAVLGLTDHPEDFAAGADRPGVAFADLGRGIPDWVDATLEDVRSADVTVLTPHWGPNMTARPVRHVAAGAAELARPGVSLIAGHSAHVFHGVASLGDAERYTAVLYDLGDLIDDYAVDPELRNDLGLLWSVTVDDGRVRRVEAMPLALDFCHTRVAEGDDRRWIADRLAAACAELGTGVRDTGDRLVVDLDDT